MAVRRPRRGVILVFVLWTVVVLSVLAATLAFDVTVNSRLARLQREQFLAYNLARSAVAAGMTDLLNDSIVDYVEDFEQPYDGFGDAWAQPSIAATDRKVQLGEDGPQRARGGRQVRFNTPTYEYDIRDEEGKIPLNAASPQLLQAIFEYYGMEQEDAQLVAAAIADFRDADDLAQARDASGLKENEYWSDQVGQDVRSLSFQGEYAVRMSNEPFHSVDQLMDVPGVPASIFYGYDPQDEEAAQVYQNRAGDLGGGGLRGPRISARAGARTGSRGDLAPLRDILTVRTWGTGASNRVNINTASPEVLAILLYAATNNTGNLQQAKSTADSYARSRGDDRPSRGMDREDAIKGPSDLAKLGGGGLQGLSDLVSNPGPLGLQIAFRSDTFEITGIGRVGNSEKIVTCWVTRTMDVFNPDDPRLIPVREDRRSIFGGGIGTARSVKRELGRDRAASAAGGAQDNFIRIPAIRVNGWYE
jgi:type II secretory pathway component PulK